MIASRCYGDRGTMTYDFGTDTIQAGRVGDRALHAMEITPELEGEWHVEDDFIAGGEIERPGPSASRFRGRRSLHARRAGRGRFARPERVGRDLARPAFSLS